MDPLTHGLLGGCVAQFSVKQVLDKTRVVTFAGICGGLAALTPDLDVLIRSETDPLLGLSFHRHFTHSLAFIPLGSLIAALILWLLYRMKFSLKETFFFATAGFATHCLLDAATNYGTHLVWPFSSHRTSISVLSIIDPLVTITLLVGFVLTLITRKIKFAKVALIVFAVYVGGGFIQKHRAQTAMEHLASARGHEIARSEVKPTIGNLLVWRTIYEASGNFYIDGFYLGPLGKIEPYEGGNLKASYPTPESFPELESSSMQFNDVKRFAFFSNNFIARDPRSKEVVGDIRFSMFPNGIEPIWGIRINPEVQSNHVSFENFRTSPTSDDWDRFFRMLRGQKLESGN